MKNFIELVVPIDREWMLMLDRIVLPITQSIPYATPYFFTNDSNRVIRLRIDESIFEDCKKDIYPLLLSQLQSNEEVKVYKQNYVLEEARFGKVSDPSFHTNLFYTASEIMIALLENAEQIDNYEIRLPYAVIAIHYLIKQLSSKEQKDLAKLYIQHWMYYNEEEDYGVLLKQYEETYSEEILSLAQLLGSLKEQKEIHSIYENWARSCKQFIQQFQSLEQTAEASHRQEAYYYKSNNLEHPRKWEVIADHIHLLLNRFGIQNEDETLLLFLTYSAMKYD